jgi:hypothetical protein
MRLLIIAAAKYGMGHAVNASRLAVRAELRGIEAWVASDQADALRGLCWHNRVVPLGRLSEIVAQRQPDLVLLDTIPLRRQDLLFEIARLFGKRRFRLLLGHMGWLLSATGRQIKQWAECLAFLKITRCVLYHPLQLCHGRCDIEQIARKLGISTIHSGLLFIGHKPSRVKLWRRLAVSFGGGGAGSDQLAQVAPLIAEANPTWKVDVFSGPYAKVREAEVAPARLLDFSDRFPARLSAYTAAVTRSGYGACVDHIAARVPTLLVPRTGNREQESNAMWAAPFLSGTVRLDSRHELIVEQHRPKKLPKEFDWLPVLEKLD